MKITMIVNAGLALLAVSLLITNAVRNDKQVKDWTKIRSDAYAAIDQGIEKANKTLDMAETTKKLAQAQLETAEETRQKLSRLPFLITLGNPTDTNRYLVKFSGYQILLNMMTNAPGSGMMQVATNMWVESDFVKGPVVYGPSTREITNEGDAREAQTFLDRIENSHHKTLEYILTDEDKKVMETQRQLQAYRNSKNK